MESQLHIYSLGVAVKSKLPGSNELLVYPTEALYSQSEGGLYKGNETFTSEADGLNSSSFATENVSTTYLVAQWLQIGDGTRVSAPDVYENEEVLIYKYADLDRYYWTDFKRQPNIRRLEDVWFALSNLSTEPGEEFDESSSYWVRWSTRDKLLHIKTTTSDGEPFEYDIKLDTRNATLSIEDGEAGNSILLESSLGNITTTVTNDASVHAGNDVITTAGNDINSEAGNNIIAHAGNDINATAESNITAVAGKDVSVSAGGGIQAEASGDVSVEAGGNIQANAGGMMSGEAASGIRLTCGGSTANITPASIELDSPTVIVGGVTFSGGNILGAGSTVGGPVVAPNNLM